MAEMKLSLGREPEQDDLQKYSVEADAIPPECPNEFVSLPSREIR